MLNRILSIILFFSHIVLPSLAWSEEFNKEWVVQSVNHLNKSNSRTITDFLQRFPSDYEPTVVLATESRSRQFASPKSPRTIFFDKHSIEEGLYTQRGDYS